MTMIGTPLTGRSRFTAVAALAIMARLLTLGPAASATATEIATLNGNDLSRVEQTFATRDVRVRRTSCSLDGPGDPPASKSLLTPRLDYRADFENEQLYSLPWIEDGERVWGMSETVLPLRSGIPLCPGFALFRIDRRRFNVSIADAKTDTTALASAHDDWGVAGQLLPLDPKSQWRETGDGTITHVAAFMQAGMQLWRFDRPRRSAAEVAKFCRFALEGLGSQSVRLFVLSEPAPKSYELWPAHDQRMLHIYDYAFRDVKPIRRDRYDFQPEHRWEGVWTKVRSVGSPIVERFHVAKNPEGHYLITDEGQLYVTPWMKPAGDTDLRPIKIRGGELIQYLIHEADRNFAFTTNYWFELKEPLEYHEFDLGTIDVKDPMTTLLRCAKELRRHQSAQPRK